MNKITVSDIINHLHKIADPSLAYDWDNVGLQLGDGNREVKKILLSLDVTEKAIDKAIRENVDMIVAHHPFIFRPIKKITNPLYLKLIRNDISVFSAHTNLDVVQKGVNFALAKKLELQDLSYLSYDTTAKQYHIAVYVPQKDNEKVKSAILEAGAGRIGNYTACSNRYGVKGEFIPGENSDPAIGKIGNLEQVEEIKLEFFVDSVYLDKVITAMKKAHPYETPAYAVYPQEKQSENFGLGLIGKLPEKITLQKLAEFVKNKLNAPFVHLWLAGKQAAQLVRKIAICGGSGSSLIPKLAGRADVFISADFTYHTILDCQIPLIDAGHFYTENPVLENLRKMLSEFNLEIIELQPQEHEIVNWKMV